ncbi:MAG: PA0069 family radical SAM protein [bacterium]|nr:PA0069 family radical SAM protein [bacterium]
MSSFDSKSHKGRGAGGNPANRFDEIAYEADPDWDARDEPGPRTVFLKDATKKVFSRNDSPDIPADTTCNPYRGCEHGCIYCYARPTHEYLGFSAGLDFETRIVVKENAPALIRKEFMSPRWDPRPVAFSGVTDPYQPIERRLQLTRRCLQVFAEFLNPVTIITKNRLIERDIDLLRHLADYQAVSTAVTMTTLDKGLNRILEPRSSLPRQRLETIARLAEAGIPVAVLVAPVIPGLNDEEIPALLKAAADAGARSAGTEVLRLPHAVAPLFEDWLERHMPDRKSKILNRIRAMRGGKLNDSRFGSRMSGEGLFAEQIANLFVVAARKYGIDQPDAPLSAESFRRPGGRQLSLFD